MKHLRYLLLFFIGSAIAQQQSVNIGTAPNNGTGDPLRTAFTKLNTNDAQLYAMFGASGLLRGNGAVPSPLTAAGSGDVISLFGAGCNGTTFLRGDGVCNTPTVSNAGNLSTSALNWTNPAALNNTNTWISEQAAFTGSINTDGIDIGRAAPNMLVYNDAVAATCSVCNNSATVASIWIHPRFINGWDGFRFGLGVYMDEQSAPVSLNNNVVAGSFLNSVTQFNSTPGSINQSDGSFWGINPNTFATAGANALNMLLVAGDETNVGINTGSSTWRKLGYSLAVNGGDSIRGYLDDHGIQFGVKDGGVGTKPGWRVGVAFSSVCCSTAPFAADSALLQTPRREVGSTTHQVTALYGADFRQLSLSANGAFFAGANFAIDPNGYVDTGTVNVAQGIVQESAQLSSITILAPPIGYGPFQGGAYNVGGPNGTNAFPPIGIQAPLTGSTTATTTGMGLVAVTLPFGGVPASGCTNGNTVTVALAGTSGNTNGTFTVTVAGGNITSATITGAGNYVSSAGDTGLSLTGGSCTAGTLTTNVSPYVLFNITAVTPSGAGTFPCNTQPSVFVSGSGYIANVNTPASFTGVLGACTAAQVNLGTNGATWTGLTQINVSNNTATSIGTGSTTSAVTLGGGSNNVNINAATAGITGTTQINVSNNAATSIGTGTTTSNVTLGGSSNKVVVASELISGGTTFTVAGTGACATTSTLSGGVQAGSFLCTGTAGASTFTITLPSSTNGWSCWGADITSGVSFAQLTPTAVNSCKMTGTIAVTSDKVVFGALGY